MGEQSAGRGRHPPWGLALRDPELTPTQCLPRAQAAALQGVGLLNLNLIPSVILGCSVPGICLITSSGGKLWLCPPAGFSHTWDYVAWFCHIIIPSAAGPLARVGDRVHGQSVPQGSVHLWSGP